MTDVAQLEGVGDMDPSDPQYYMPYQDEDPLLTTKEYEGQVRSDLGIGDIEQDSQGRARVSLGTVHVQGTRRINYVNVTHRPSYGPRGEKGATDLGDFFRSCALEWQGPLTDDLIRMLVVQAAGRPTKFVVSREARCKTCTVEAKDGSERKFPRRVKGKAFGSAPDGSVADVVLCPGGCGETLRGYNIIVRWVSAFRGKG